MATQLRRSLTVLVAVLAVIASYFAITPILGSASTTGTGTIVTDQVDYPPGATVTVTGAGWVSDEAVHVVVDDTAGKTWQNVSSPDPVAGASGEFTYQFVLPTWFVSNYTVTASGPISGEATTTFTDMSIGTYDQCANDTGSGPLCDWINGNLNKNNSIYMEGDSTVQRLWLTDLAPGTTHTVTLKYNTTTSGKHAYDFLTTWDWSEDWVTTADRCQDIGGCTTAAETALDIPQDPNVPDSFEPSAAGDRQFVMRGGTLVSATTPAVVSGSYSGTSETAIAVTFTTASSGDMCSTKGGVTTCGVALWFGAHVATQANWGLGTGAGSISGSPYHAALDKVDGASAGQRDNQMDAGVVDVIPNGTIVVVKDAVPNGPQDFGFNINNSSTISQDFSLDDDSDATLPNSQTFSVPPGTWTARELNLPMTGWDLTNLSCSVAGTNGSSATTDLASGEATVALKSNDTVTCTYTNTKRGSIVINKTAVGGDATFGYTTTGGDGLPAGFSITTSGGSGSQTYTNIVPGSYSVAETSLAGWTLTSSSCDSGTPGSFTVAAGQTVTCTFTNTRTYNKDLTVTKTAAPSFSRLYSWLIDKSVDQTQINVPSGTPAGFTYSVKVTPNGYTDSAWAVSGKITVSNANGFAVSGVNVTDTIDNGGACSVTGGTNVTVPAGGSVVLDYTCTYAAAPTKPAGTNTATATWTKATYDTPNGSASGTAGVDFATTTPAETNKTVTVVDDKTDPAHPVTLGTWSWADGEHTFTYSLDKAGVGGTCTDYTNTATIDETGQSDSQKVTVCVGKDLTVAKTASGTFDRTYLWNIGKDVDQTLVKIAEGGSNTFHYTVAVDQTGITDAGWTLAGKITLTNPNDWEDITLTTLTDSVTGGGTCTLDPGPYVVPKSGSLDVSYQCTYATQPASYSGTNTATATWDSATAFTPTGTASGTAGFTLSQLGSTNKTVNVTDSYAGDLGAVTATDATPFAKGTFTYERTETGVAGACTDYTNTATITETGATADKTVTLCVGKDLTVAKTATGTYGRTYHWLIDKSVDQTKVDIAAGGTATFNYKVKATPDGFTDGNWTLGGTITVTNPNAWEAVTLTGVDDTVPGGTCTVAESAPYVVPAGGSLALHYSCTFTGEPGSTNTATVTWDKAVYATPSGSATGTAALELSVATETNKTVTVVDDKTDPANPVTLGQADYYAGPFEFTYSLDKAGVGGTCTDYTNTATIDETGRSDSQKVTVCVGTDLTVAKTAAGTFDRTYLWNIGKDVDQTSVNIAEGGSNTFHYTVTVEQTGLTDAGWKLSGKITISNPNAWEAVTLTGLTDAVDNGGTCTVDPGPYVVPAGGWLDVGYQCTYASAPSSYSGTNTATATWDKAAAFTPGGMASGSAPFTLAQAGATNRTVHVTDSYGGDLGSVTATDTAPFAKATFTYDRTESGVAGKCTTYDNTATITETKQTAGKTVTLCVGKDLTVAKTAAGTFNRAYLWKIGKDADQTLAKIADGSTNTFNYTVVAEQTGVSDSGWTITGKITVTNPNDWQAVMLTGLTDVVDNGGTCTVDPTLPLVPKSGSVEVAYQCTYASQPASYSGTNTATATWNSGSAFTPTGTASGSAPFTMTQVGSADKTVHVTDSYAGSLGTVTATDAVPFAKGTFTYGRTESGVAGTCTDYKNTATITETGAAADKTVTLCVGKDLTVDKTAVPSFTRTYTWSIDKSVVGDSSVTTTAATAPFDYSVRVEQTGFTDSAWQVKGTITVTNPNDWESVSASVSDAVDNGGACLLSASGVTVPKGGKATVAYACVYLTKPTAASGTNTATATWDKAIAFTPTGSASGTKDFAFVTPTATVDKTVTVTDSEKGQLGTLTATDDPAAFTSQTYAYTLTWSTPLAACKSYVNTATIVETKQTDSQTVRVCRPNLFTDSSLCTFDFDTSAEGQQFRLTYTPDQTAQGAWKLNASNPGQFYYNVFYSGDGGETITLTLPYPWVTQGAVPVHVYQDVTSVTQNGRTCLTPIGDTGFSGKTTQVSLGAYTPPAFGSTATVEVEVPPLTSGFAYINIHLDYGLKGTTGYAKDANNNAVQVGTSTIVIPDKQAYTFSDSVGDPVKAQSFNAFKKDPGIGGLVLTQDTTEPLGNVPVKIYDANNKQVASLTTDEDGWYMWQYKYTGKPTTYKVTAAPAGKPPQSQTVAMKSNGYVVVSFNF